MPETAPQLDRLLHRLADCPGEFFQPGLQVDVAAIVCDVLRSAPRSAAPELETARLELLRRRREEARSLICLAAWLLHDAELLQCGATKLWDVFLAEDWEPLAKLIRAEKFTSDPDRREEFARLCLAMLGLQAAGESAAQFNDRLSTLSSVGRERILRETAKAERRAREIREAMARQKALESASRFGE